MSQLEWILGVAMLAGLVGVVDQRSATAWIVLGIMTILAVGGILAGSLLPAHRASRAGAPRWVLAAGGIGMVVGFFVIPVLGAFVGGPAGIFLAELLRVRDPALAWRTTLETVRGLGLGAAAQVALGVIMVALWAAVAWTT